MSCWDYLIVEAFEVCEPASCNKASIDMRLGSKIICAMDAGAQHSMLRLLQSLWQPSTCTLNLSGSAVVTELVV
jgi:hypothetical protein